ncbi:polyphosphate polymerase domain-containing protein [Clostridium malenominatum]|uniref:Polyphosphate polymerase domain-containing protein n=1 Tax=Clostridium malenominatum TaxID=1539 RepID=A0ABN1J108_9CLOT
MENESIVLRTEKKYEISHFTAAQLKFKLSTTLKKDINNKGNGYMVRSLYFDTLYDNDYNDKENGIENRRKIRLRIYDPTSKTLKLELKQKQGENQLKRSLTISKETAEKLIKGDYDSLREYESELANELAYIMKKEFYRPKCIVEYDRLAYIVKENSTRITIDSNIRSTEANFDLFSSDLALIPINSIKVLEVKYDNFLLSYIKDVINIANKTQISISKYYLARQMRYF